MTAAFRLTLLLLLALVCAAPAQTAREQLKEAGTKLYSVIFGLTVGADGKIGTLKVSKVIDPGSGTTDPVTLQVPQAYLDAAKRKAEGMHYPPKVENGKPVEFFTYFLYSPKYPQVVITDLDQPLDKQP